MAEQPAPGPSGSATVATLEYAYAGWEAFVNQTNTITVLGEETAPLSGEEIIVNVPLSKLKECIVYDSKWTQRTGEAAGEQPLPHVEFRPSESYAAMTELTSIFDRMKAKMDDEPLLNDRVWDDDAENSHESFGKILISNVEFNGSIFDSEDLPKVAIRKIEEGDIDVQALTTTVAKVSTTNITHKVHLEGLFEQLVASDRIKLSDVASENDASFGTVKMPSLLVGDSLSFNVTYSFTKTREYELDGEVSAGSKKALTLTIGGSTFTINADGADGSEVSNEYSRTYSFKLVAIDDAK